MKKISISLDSEAEKTLKQYMIKNNINARSVAIRECLTKALINDEYISCIYELEKKLNRLLYRQAMNKNLLEQLFSNFGFSANEDTKKDSLLKEVYEKNNKYGGMFD